MAVASKSRRKPDGTVPKQINLPNELHKKIKTLSGHGGTESLILECIEEGIKPRWKKWLEVETDKLVDSSHEGGQAEVRHDAGSPDPDPAHKA